MADLSDLLGDVYGTDETPIHSQPTPTTPPVPPSWADEARLDGFFAGWIPGSTEEPLEPEPEPEVGPEPDDAVLSDVPAGDVALSRPELVAVPGVRLPAAGRLDDDLALALSAALAAAPVSREAVEVPAEAAALALPPLAAEVAPAPVEEPVVEEPARPWQRCDDDLLPSRSRRRGFLRR